MSATKADANAPIGIENFPRFHGPGRNLLPTKKTRMKMGIVNALQSHDQQSHLQTPTSIPTSGKDSSTHTKAAIAPIENSAPIAKSPPKISSSNRIPIAQLNHTAFAGVCVYLFTFFQYVL